MFRKVFSIESEVAQAAESEVKRRELIVRTQRDIRADYLLLAAALIMGVAGFWPISDFLTGTAGVMFCSGLFSLLDDRKRLRSLETGDIS